MSYIVSIRKKIKSSSRKIITMNIRENESPVSVANKHKHENVCLLDFGSELETTALFDLEIILRISHRFKYNILLLR